MRLYERIPGVTVEDWIRGSRVQSWKHLSVDELYGFRCAFDPLDDAD